MNRNSDELGLEAGEWLLRLNDAQLDPEDGFADLASRNEAFYAWIGQSPEYLRVFLETIETHRRLAMIDPDQVIEVEALLSRRFADVIPLRRRLPEKKKPASASTRKRDNGKKYRMAAIAAAVLLAICAVGYQGMRNAGAYTTSIGEQRTAKLEDGSFIYLNTDTRVEVDFSAGARNVHLIRGEALFVVERDSARPFTVTAGETTVRALGTQFNVRRRAEGADVSVVEGSVQVTARNAPAKLVAGQTTQVVKGHVAPPAQSSTADAVAWRQRRLVFHDERLADVAEEFNRYNRTKIRIEGASAQDVRLSGIFDADRPQALMLYAAKSTEFTVEPEGNDWVVRGR